MTYRLIISSSIGAIPRVFLDTSLFQDVHGYILQQLVIDLVVVNIRSKLVWIPHGHFKYLSAFADNPGTKIMEAIVAHTIGDYITGRPQTPLVQIADLLVKRMAEFQDLVVA